MNDIFNMTKICPVCGKPITLKTMTGEQLMNDLIGTELVVVQMCKDCKYQSEKQTQKFLRKELTAKHP